MESLLFLILYFISAMIARNTATLFLIFFGIGILSGCFSKHAQRREGKINTNDFHIFILMGQSNMSGYGGLLPGDSMPVKNVYKLPTLYKDSLAWEPAGHPLHNRLSSDRFGMGLTFATRYLADHPGVIVGLVPLAYGGAGIDNLKKGSKVYEDFLVKLSFIKKTGAIKAVLWHQGESDTVTEELALQYQKKLDQLVMDIRNDTGIPDLPFITGNLAEFYGTGREHNSPDRVARINTVRTALRTLPNRIKHAGFAETTGATSIDGHMVHFDRDSYILLGNRYYDVYTGLEGK